MPFDNAAQSRTYTQNLSAPLRKFCTSPRNSIAHVLMRSLIDECFWIDGDPTMLIGVVWVRIEHAQVMTASGFVYQDDFREVPSSSCLVLHEYGPRMLFSMIRHVIR